MLATVTTCGAHNPPGPQSSTKTKQIAFSFSSSELKQMGLNHLVPKQNKLHFAFDHPD